MSRSAVRGMLKVTCCQPAYSPARIMSFCPIQSGASRNWLSELSSKRTSWPLSERLDSPRSWKLTQARGGKGALPSVRPKENSLWWKFARMESTTPAGAGAPHARNRSKAASSRRENDPFMRGARQDSGPTARHRRKVGEWGLGKKRGRVDRPREIQAESHPRVRPGDGDYFFFSSAAPGGGGGKLARMPVTIGGILFTSGLSASRSEAQPTQT